MRSDSRTRGPELPSQREYRLKKEKEAEDARKKTTWLQRMKQIARVIGAVGVAGLGAYAGYKGFNGKSKDNVELARHLVKFPGLKSSGYAWTPEKIQRVAQGKFHDRL